jgi:enoyl-CoA hydratase/carnithine racemase
MGEAQGSGLTVERHDAVVVVRWDRQHVRNALDPATIIELAHTLDDAARDGATRAAVLTGTGDVAFCAGMDLKALAADRAKAGEAYAAWMGTLNSPDRLPLVAAVNGMAMGGGMEIALRCDLIVAGDHCEFGLPEVKGAMVPHGGALDFPSLVPMQTALEWGLLGERIPAGRLRELGVVNRVVPAADVVPTAIALGQQLAAFDPDTVRGIRNGMWKQ